MSLKSALGSLLEVLLAGLKKTAVGLVIAAENALEGETGAEKRAYVVNQLDELLDLPWLLEYLDGPILGILVDSICDRLNLLTDNDFADVDEETAAEAVAASLEATDEEVEETVADAETVEEKFAALLEKYGVAS